MNDSQVTTRTLFRVSGIPLTFDAQSWKFVPPKLVIGTLVALVTLTNDSIGVRVIWGLVYGLLLLAVLCLHILGHVASSKLVTPPMSELFITPVLIQTLYHTDTADTPGRVHLIRSLGGPVTTLVIGSSTLVLWSATGGHALLFFALANFVILGIVLLPFPTVDGEVIWREVRRMMKG